MPDELLRPSEKFRADAERFREYGRETGRRISAICSLHARDIRFDGPGPFGSILWPEDTDKEETQYYAPLSADARAAIDRILTDRPTIGYLFPSPRAPERPISRHLADAWLRRAVKKAELKPLSGSLWHTLRRRWVTKRKHHPLKDVAAAGGWASVESLQHYMGADEDTMVSVVLDARELPERAVLSAS